MPGRPGAPSGVGPRDRRERRTLMVGLVDGGAGLGMMWGRQSAIQMLNDAGFKAVQVLDIPEDPFNLHFLCRKKF